MTEGTDDSIRREARRLTIMLCCVAKVQFQRHRYHVEMRSTALRYATT